MRYVLQSVASEDTVQLFDSSSNPVTGVAFDEVEVYIRKEAEPGYTAKSILVGDWEDRGGGNYSIDFVALDFSVLGLFQYQVIPSSSNPPVTAFTPYQDALVVVDEIPVLPVNVPSINAQTDTPIGISPDPVYRGDVLTISGSDLGDALQVTIGGIVVPIIYNTNSEIQVTVTKPPDTLETGVAQTATANDITLAATANAVDDYYNGYFVEISSGTGIGQTREITDYTGLTKVADVISAWTVTPDSTSVYRIKNSDVTSFVALGDAQVVSVVTSGGTDTSAVDVVLAPTDIPGFGMVNIFGYVHSIALDGAPLAGVGVLGRVLDMPNIGDGVAWTDDVKQVNTDANGYFSIKLPRSVRVEIQIPKTRYRREFITPNVDSANLYTEIP